MRSLRTRRALARAECQLYSRAPARVGPLRDPRAVLWTAHGPPTREPHRSLAMEEGAAQDKGFAGVDAGMWSWVDLPGFRGGRSSGSNGIIRTFRGAGSFVVTRDPRPAPPQAGKGILAAGLLPARAVGSAATGFRAPARLRARAEHLSPICASLVSPHLAASTAGDRHGLRPAVIGAGNGERERGVRHSDELDVRRSIAGGQVAGVGRRGNARRQ